VQPTSQRIKRSNSLANYSYSQTINSNKNQLKTLNMQLNYMRCTRLRSPSLEVGPRRERVSLRFDLATTCYIHCKKNFKKFVFLGCTIIQDVIGSSAVLATNRSAYHHYSNDSSCTTQWASESGTTSSSVCLTYRAGFSVVCFTRDRVGSALYSFGHGLHSYLVHFSTSDGHPCLQESRCYLQ
jgi:hypothetical protein